MEEPDGPGPSQRAAASNETGPEGAVGVVSGRREPLLEVLLVLMCSGAVMGNILVLVIVAATRTLHAVTSVLIMNLAISDLLVGIGVMPSVALSIMNHGWAQCTELCLYVGYTSSVFCTASVLTLAAIALDRYLSIMDCLRYSSRCTLWRTCAVVLWIWLQALATCSPPLLGWSSITYVVPMYNCATNWASSPSYTAFMAIFSYLIPAVVILFCYVNIVKVAHSHARRIHTLEDSVQRRSNSCIASSQSDSSQQNCRSPWRLICHINGEFVSQFSSEANNMNHVLPESPTQRSNSAPRRLFSFLAQSSSQPTVQNHHHGVMRVLLIIAAFLICWTPYISFALVQATETAVAGRSSLIPESAITFSYWLMLLNSDINPLLYALLSKRFQSALWGLGRRIRAHLGSVLGREGEVRAEDELRNNEPCTPTSPHPSPRHSTESFTCEHSSIFTVSARFKHHSELHVCKTCHRENTSSSSVWPESGSDRKHNLQVPSRPQEGSRLPFSALTKEQQATFFFGQITVSVEHDIC
ncbi:5-hydroxytryptamine receptor 1D [Kryptolebias marmoratus]|uniref:5-hydroxytryptamine receptor 1D-like n=1 Tax=Kryptolebias marmoratus TaxID=37003 RepID=A0A3Q3B3N5_KRYMA|nr:5-hydroxytryptamine receptor 1D [Kryptolebias marmoratus]